MNFKFDHIAIQTDNFDNTVNWYKTFFSCQRTWSRTWEQLPLQIQTRMPFANQLVELRINDMRFHIFDIKDNSIDLSAHALQYQHFGVVVDSIEELENLRHLWLDLYSSNQYTFKKPTLPTGIITSSDGMHCFYAFDPNGLEFEVIYFQGNS